MAAGFEIRLLPITLLNLRYSHTDPYVIGSETGVAGSALTDRADPRCEIGTPSGRISDLRYFRIRSEKELACLVSMPYEVYLWIKRK